VSSGAYRAALDRLGRPLTVTEVAAPDLAPLIQEGSPFDEGVMDMVRSYCEPLKRAEIDTLVLGCTHYPLVAPMLQRLLGRDVRLVTAGHAIAAAVQRTLAADGSLSTERQEGDYRFLVTGDLDSFVEVGTRFLQLPLAGRIESVSVER
jgi:glutamate racemase